ncbi:Rv0361 family membrane protein [Mycobacterium deserti]|uniref:Transcriptional regulator n=1 Tax=Mycobacterium deserti TaxID=2978347 RepID=A0ABT2M9U2_9MYCO|nr:transcriptional regulator [Mycobacterium deserti]MCT7658706.1 transcriptional regulator [Mycobacterium deserti]
MGFGLGASIAIGGAGIAVALAGATPAAAATDADQVRAVLEGMNTSYNRADYDKFSTHLCSEMREAAGFEAGWYASRKSDGPTRITVNSVVVVGDGAVANVRFEAADHTETLDVDFVRENASWKACRYHGGQTV